MFRPIRVSYQTMCNFVGRRVQRGIIYPPDGDKYFFINPETRYTDTVTQTGRGPILLYEARSDSGQDVKLGNVHSRIFYDIGRAEVQGVSGEYPTVHVWAKDPGSSPSIWEYWGTYSIVGWKWIKKPNETDTVTIQFICKPIYS